MGKLLKKAIDPKQYDLELDWCKMTEESPSRRHHKEFLEKEIGNLKGKSVIDIGSGTGYLSKMLKEKGARDLYGVEPSEKNVQVSRKYFPDLEVQRGTLQTLKVNRKFDIALAVLVFEHLEDPKKGLKKISRLLKKDGLLYLMVGDKDYLCKDRFGYKIQKEDLGNGMIVVSTTRSKGTMSDIVRPLEMYKEAASWAGFNLIKHIPMPPTKDYLNADPKYVAFKDKPLFHLLILKKNS